MKSLLLAFIRFYRRRLSAGKRRPVCRFTPTCSEYAQQAIERFGAARGGQMAIRRILRCHPLGKGGYDPVPEEPRVQIRRE